MPLLYIENIGMKFNYDCITIEDIPDRLYLLLQDAYQEHLLNIKINSI